MLVSAYPQANVRIMEKNQRATKEWILAVADYLHLSPSRLALNAGAAASTLTRFLNDTTNTLTITQRTLDMIATYSGVPVHKMPGQKPRGLGDEDVVPYNMADINVPAWMHDAINAIVREKNNTEVWIAKGWALDIAGILPNDAIVIDYSRKPQNGDVVLARIHDANGNDPQQVLRLYEAPYLMAHSAKLGVQRPLVVDEHLVSIMGVCTGVFQLRH